MIWTAAKVEIAKRHGYKNFNEVEWLPDGGGLELDVAYREAAELMTNEIVNHKLEEVWQLKHYDPDVDVNIIPPEDIRRVKLPFSRVSLEKPKPQ